MSHLMILIPLSYTNQSRISHLWREFYSDNEIFQPVYFQNFSCGFWCAFIIFRTLLNVILKYLQKGLINKKPSIPIPLYFRGIHCKHQEYLKMLRIHNYSQVFILPQMFFYFFVISLLVSSPYLISLYEKIIIINGNFIYKSSSCVFISKGFWGARFLLFFIYS